MAVNRPHLGRAAGALLIALLLHLIADGAGLALPRAEAAGRGCRPARACALVAEGHVACLHTPPRAARPSVVAPIPSGQHPRPLRPSLAPLTPPPLAV